MRSHNFTTELPWGEALGWLRPLLMAPVPPRRALGKKSSAAPKKKSKSGSSGEIKATKSGGGNGGGEKSGGKMPIILGAVAVIAVIAVVGTMFSPEETPVVSSNTNGTPAVTPAQPAPADNAGNPAPAGPIVDGNGPTVPASNTPSSVPAPAAAPSKVSKNPLVAFIKRPSLESLLGGSQPAPGASTLFITLENGQHIPVTVAEHTMYQRGEISREQIQFMMRRANNFVIGEQALLSDTDAPELVLPPPPPAVVHIPTSAGQNGMLLGTVNIGGSSSGVPSFLVHPAGAMVIPSSAIGGGGDIRVSIAGKVFRSPDVKLGPSLPGTGLTVLLLPPQPEPYPAVPLSGSDVLEQMAKVALSQGASGTPREVKVSFVSYQMMLGGETIPAPGRFLLVENAADLQAGLPLLDTSGSLLGYTVTAGFLKPDTLIAVSTDQLRPIAEMPLASSEGSDPAAAGNQALDFGSGQINLAGNFLKAYELFLAASVVETRPAWKLLTKTRYVQLGVMVRGSGDSATLPNDAIAKAIGVMGKQGLDRSELELLTTDKPGKSEDATVLICLVDYRPPTSTDPAVTNPETTLNFRLLAFGRDPEDVQRVRYVRIWESDTISVTLPTSAIDQGINSRNLKEQIGGLFAKFRSGVLKASRELERP